MYIALFGLSLFTFVGGMVTTDADAIRRTLDGRLNTSLNVFAGVELVLGATLAAPIGITTLVFMTGDTVSISPVAAVFTFLPILVSAVLAVVYLRSMRRRPQPSGERD